MIKPNIVGQISTALHCLTKLELIFYRVYEILAELAGMEFHSRRRARGRDPRSIFHRDWHVQFAAFLAASDVQNCGWQGERGERGGVSRFFSASRSLARLLADLPRTWWGINDTCQRANTERRPDPWPPFNVQLRKAGPIFCPRPPARASGRAWGDSCPYAIANFACKCPAVRPRSTRITINNDQRANYRPAWFFFCAMYERLFSHSFFLFEPHAQATYMARYVHACVACLCTTVFHELRTHATLIYHILAEM